MSSWSWSRFPLYHSECSLFPADLACATPETLQGSSSGTGCGLPASQELTKEGGTNPSRGCPYAHQCVSKKACSLARRTGWREVPLQTAPLPAGAASTPHAKSQDSASERVPPENEGKPQTVSLDTVREGPSGTLPPRDHGLSLLSHRGHQGRHSLRQRCC